MKKNIIGGVLCAMFFALCSSAQAQQPREITVIGVFSRARLGQERDRIDGFAPGSGSSGR